jgi:hypothetical protein
VNQAYVIATSTKIQLPKLDLSKFTDKYFQGVETRRSKKGEGVSDHSKPSATSLGSSIHGLPGACCALDGQRGAGQRAAMGVSVWGNFDNRSLHILLMHAQWSHSCVESRKPAFLSKHHGWNSLTFS